uniref:Uncharacterized protein n=1 Tax=Arundo donax TaxID=35708 RepID=A0A0A9FN72_ARUDO
MRAKWLSPHARADEPSSPAPAPALASFSGEFELRFDDTAKAPDAAGEEGEKEKITVVVSPSLWRPVEEETEASTRIPPAAKGKVIAGLAAVL